MTSPSEDSQPWSEYRRLVIDNLERIDARLDHLEEMLRAHGIALAVEKVKMAIIGAISGALFGGVIAFLAHWAGR